MKKIYMDYAAATPVRDEVITVMAPYFSEVFGNPSSVHSAGRKSRDILENARKKVADSIGVSTDEIIFTSGGTESDNLAITGLANAAGQIRKHIITSSIEHPAVHETCKNLSELGYEITYLPVDKWGVVDLKHLEKSFRDDTLMVSVMMANNETGVIQPVSEIADLAHQHGVPVHTDAVQAFGKIPVNPEELGVDLLSISGHKVNGPKGAGVLYVRKGLRFSAIMGGGKQELGLRPGTQNIPAVAGMAEAMRLAILEMDETINYIKDLRDFFQNQVQSTIPAVRLNGHPDKRLPNILNLSFVSASGEALMKALDDCGIAVSYRSACASGSLEPSHVLQAMGLPSNLAESSVRFSLSRDISESDIHYVAVALKGCVSRLRSVPVLDTRDCVCNCAGGECG